jgi:iron complex outermembrane recepter protein
MACRWLLLFCSLGRLFAQTPLAKDSTSILNEVVVKAYSYNRSLKESPVSLGLVAEKDFSRFSPNSILSAVNTVPGVRMEERSPGSYRFSIRGSTIRSPFGVRDVKFYWNGLPLTDGGGNTYLNLLDFDAFGKAEIIKGPGASLYGAGTGGVVLLTSPLTSQKRLQFSVSGGSFGLQRYQGNAAFGDSKKKIYFNYAHQQSDGYRQQTAMRRDALNLEGNFSINSKSTLQASVFYTDLFYQTPGGLTLAQYNTDPQQARPPSKTTFGAVQQQAAVFNKTIFGGVVYERQWASHWSTRAGLYSSYTDFTNPSILNYERRTEYNYGGRTDTQYDFEKRNWKGKITGGAEWQHFYSPLTDYGNYLGAKDTVQTDDRLTANILLFFAQAEIEFTHQFYFTVGGSANFLKYRFNRLAGSQPGQQLRNFDPVFSPRAALLKKFNESFSAFASVGKGFSAPSLAEVRPSSGIYTNTLNPEQGINYELGVRGKLLKSLTFDIVTYDFELSQAIVSQNNGEYYINAGNTSQKGLEAFLSWHSATWSGLFSHLRIWGSYTLTNYRFVNYAHDGVNYSGNKWTGTAPNTLVTGLDVYFLKNFYWNTTTSYVDRIPLNDANTAYSSDYFLLGSRFGFKNQIRNNTSMEIFAGIDNALNQKYSLGNDLNAALGRYYNAAATRNFYFGVKITPLLRN